MNFYQAQLIAWRQQINPLRQLTFSRIISLLEQSELGYYADLTWLMRFVEKREPMLKAVKERRISAIRKLDHSVKIKSWVEDQPGLQKLAEAQQTFLKARYDAIDNLSDAIEWLCSAEFRGFAHLEKWFSPLDGSVYHLEPVPQWFWCRKAPSPSWLYNETAMQTQNGIDINGLRQQFVIRECDSPIDEIGVICFLRKNLSQKDWDAFVETYGIPPIFVTLPEGAKPGDKTAFQELADNIIGDGRGVLPHGSTVTTVQGQIRATHPFKEHLDYQDQNIVVAATSGKLTVLNDATGLGSGQSDAHVDTFNDLAKAEAKRISEVFNRDFDAFELAKQFPGQPVLVYWEINEKEETDLNELADQLVKLSTAGLDADEQEMSEKFGIKLTKAPTPVPLAPGARGNLDPTAKPGALVRNRAGQVNPSLQEKSLVAFAHAVAADWAHIGNRLKAVMAMDNAEMRDMKLKSLIADLPGLLKDLNRDPDAARALERGLTAAFLNGVTEGEKARV